MGPRPPRKQFSLKWKKISSGRPGILVEEYPRARESSVANDLGRSERRSQIPPPVPRGDSDKIVIGARPDDIRRESECDDDPVGPLVNYLPDSVYLWACGAKCQASDEEVSHSDILVGWLTLLAQMAGYVVLIVHVDKPEAGKFSIYSVTLAMFLIGSISASDVRVAVTMIFWSNSGLRRVFGVLLLCSAALLVLATIRILFNSDDGTADMVIDAANVLFIAEVDAQVMLFLHGIPQRWRLFSLLEIMGISFWLALITIVHIGDTNATVPYLTDTTMGVHEIVLPFYAFAFTPGTLTMVAFLINFLVTSIPVPTDSDGVPRVRLTHSIGMASRLIVSGIYAFVVDDLIFALALLAWVAFGSALAAVVSLNILLRDEIPGRFILELVCVVAACFVVGSLFILHRKFGARETPNGSPNESSPTSIAASLPRWSVLFVGWGFGSVISGFLMISTRTEPVVTLVGAIPIFLSGIFLFAEPEILGPTIGGFLKPAAAMLGDSRSVLHWSLASSLHFLMVSWVTDFAAYSYFRVIR